MVLGFCPSPHCHLLSVICRTRYQTDGQSGDNKLPPLGSIKDGKKTHIKAIENTYRDSDQTRTEEGGE